MFDLILASSTFSLSHPFLSYSNPTTLASFHFLRYRSPASGSLHKLLAFLRMYLFLAHSDTRFQFKNHLKYVYIIYLFGCLGVSCGMQDFLLILMGFSLVVLHELQCVGSAVVVHGLSCPTARGILITQPGIKPTFPAFEDGFLTNGP